MIIRQMKEADRDEVIEMMRVFYHSEAVLTDGSDEIFTSDFNNCISENPYLDGYIFEENNSILGYSMIAKSFSTEFGKTCIWIEDIYIKPEYQGQGIGQNVLEYMANKYDNAVIRLEVEEENQRAVHVYEKSGFTVLPYMEMIKR